MAGADPLAALIAEAQHAGGPVQVPIGDHVFAVRPVWQWPWDTIGDLLRGWYHRWAGKALDGDGSQRFRALDPTNDEVGAFLAAWEARGGDSMEAMRRLAPILTDHAAALRGDLALAGPDLRDLFRPNGGASGMTWRHLLALWEALPGHCVTKTALRDQLGDERLAELAEAGPTGGHGAWSHEALLLAGLRDDIRRLTWRFEQASFKDGQKIPAPDPYPRPGVIPKRRKKLNDGGLAYLQHLRANRGAAPPGTKSLGAVGGR